TRCRRDEMSKHTPGPWLAQRCYVTRPEPNMQVMAQGGDLYIAAVEFSADPEHVSFVKDVEEMRANAFLIAAAPDLLEALKELKQLLDMVLAVNGGLPPHANGPA